MCLSRWLVGCETSINLPITVSAHPWPGYEFMFLAEREQWLDNSLVTLVETASATESLELLRADKVDGAALTLDEVLTARASGLSMTTVMIFNISAGADMLLSRSGIFALADLKGRRVGVEQGAVGSLMLSKALDSVGLTIADIQLIPLTIDRHFETWQRNEIDALVTFEPVAGRLLDEGAVKLFDSRQIPDTIFDVLAFNTERLDFRHAHSIRHLIDANFRALEHLSKNPQDAAYRMAPRLNLPPSKVLGTFKGLLLPDRTNNRRLIGSASPVLLDSARELSRFMFESGRLSREDDLNGLIDGRYL
ncbi:MAG: ABC transporter substrate-binding protein [Methylomicrobium sp.]